MAFNVSDYENFIRSYIVASIKEKYPEIDTSLNSTFDDLFIKPLIETIKEPINVLNSLEFKMNLKNAEFMTKEDLDDIGENNYLVPRNDGAKASTTLIMSFSTISNGSNLIISTGTTFETSSGVKFQTTQDYSFTPTEMLLKYNPSKVSYDVEVFVEALDIGTGYNVSENQINISTSKFSNLISVMNPSSVTNGTDEESNYSYAERIKEFYVSRQLGTDPGYQQDIFSNFAEVEDVYVVGYGDEEMERDLVTLLKNGEEVETHIGGKIDIYIKGSTYNTNIVSLSMNSAKLLLDHPYSQVDVASILVDNVTDVLKDPVFSVINDNDKCYVALGNTSEESYNPELANIINVAYEYNDGAGIVAHDKNFNVGLSSVVLETPFKSVVSVYQTNDTTVSYDSSNYSIYRERIDGTVIVDGTDPYYETTQENVNLVFNDNDIIDNGTALTIEYTTNKTLVDLKTRYDLEENRIITTDILFKEASPVFVNLKLSMKLKSSQELDDVKVAAVSSSISDYFDGLGLGDAVEESDIVGWLYRDANISSFMEYVNLPLAAFYIPDQISDEIIDQRDGTFIDTENTQYPVLNKLSIVKI